MPIYEIPAALFPALAYAISTMKDGVPNRWDKVAKYIHQFCLLNPSALNSTPLKIGFAGNIVSVRENPSPAVLRKLHDTMLASPSKEGFLNLHDFQDGFSGSSDVGVYPLVLIPNEKSCNCSGELITYPRPAFVHVYGHSGLEKASSYHKKCSRCSTKYYHSYTHNAEGVKTFRPESISQDLFMISNRSGFRVNYLRTMSDILENTAATFTGVAESYECTHLVKLEDQRLEEAYFLFRLLQVFNSHNTALEIPHRDESCRVNLEYICHSALELMTGDNSVDTHACDFPGCSEGFLMADGIEKIHRRTCAAPRSSLRLHASMPRMISSCPETPQRKSEYCEDHSYLEASSTQPAVKKPHVIITIDSVNLRSSSKVVHMTDNIPDNEDTSVHVGCKNAKNVDRFRNRSAGLMALVRPCGIIVDAREMLTCESPSQLFAQLLALRCDRSVHFKYIGYDRACEFQPFLNNLSNRGNEGAKIMLKDTRYLVDRFHVKGHVNPKCDLNSSVCEFHPDLPCFEEIKHTNTECAEQCFSFFKRFGGMCKYMSQHKYHFFLKNVISARNAKLIRRQNC